MDYSKWRKILIIISIINLLWIFYNRVFASELLSYDDCIVNNKCIINNQTFTFPEYVLDFKYQIFTRCYNTWYIIFSDNELAFKNQSPYHTTIGTKNYFNGSSVPADTLYYKIQTTNNSYDTPLNEKTPQYTSFSDAWVSPDNPNTGTYQVYFCSNFNVYDMSGNLLNQGEVYRKPTFDNSDSEIQSLDFDYLYVNPQDYGTEQKLYLKILEVTNVVTDPQDVTQNLYYYNDLTFALNNKSKYLKQFFDSGTYYYSIPYSALKLKKDNSYYFVLTSSGNEINQSVGELLENENIFDIILCDTQDLITTQDEILNSIINNNPSQNTNDNINNNLPRPSYNDSDNNINIPGMNVEIPNDITENGFNNIFTTIYNTLYSATQPHPGSEFAPGITFTIPFVNHTFTIDPLLTINLLYSYPSVLTLIQTFYLFLVSYYIVNDIRKTIEKVKSGDIMTHTDTNIKANML